MRRPRSASSSACSSTIGPRPRFTRCAVGFIAPSTAASTRPRVCSVSGATTTTWSAQPTCSTSRSLASTSPKSGIVGAPGAADPAHPHAHRAQQPRGGPADRAGADHQRRLAGQRLGLLVPPVPRELPVVQLVQPLDPGQDRRPTRTRPSAGRTSRARWSRPRRTRSARRTAACRRRPRRCAPSAARSPAATRRAARWRRSPTATARPRPAIASPSPAASVNRSVARPCSGVQVGARPTGLDQHRDRPVAGPGRAPGEGSNGRAIPGGTAAVTPVRARPDRPVRRRHSPRLSNDRTPA